jgi:hypothetical protein
MFLASSFLFCHLSSSDDSLYSCCMELHLYFPFCFSLQLVDFISSTFSLILFFTIPRLRVAAWCISSRGSPGSGLLVSKYACAAINAASGVSCMKSSSSSSNCGVGFLEYLSSLLCAVAPLLCFGSPCLSLLYSESSL